MSNSFIIENRREPSKKNKNTEETKLKKIKEMLIECLIWIGENTPYIEE